MRNVMSSLFYTEIIRTIRNTKIFKHTQQRLLTFYNKDSFFIVRKKDR